MIFSATVLHALNLCMHMRASQFCIDVNFMRIYWESGQFPRIYPQPTWHHIQNRKIYITSYIPYFSYLTYHTTWLFHNIRRFFALIAWDHDTTTINECTNNNILESAWYISTQIYCIDTRFLTSMLLHSILKSHH